MPLIEVLAAMERAGVKLDAKRLAEIGAGHGRADRRARARDLRARRARVHDRLAAAARRGAVRGARADQEAPRQDGLLDRRPGARPDPRRARDRRQGRELARADEAQEHLPRRPARADRPRDGSHPHHLQPGRHDHGAPLEHQPEPPEHPDPLRDRQARSEPASSPSAACACCRPTTTRSSCGCSPTSPARTCCARSSPRARTSTARPPPRCSSISARGGRPGRALEGEDGQLRDRLRAVGVRARGSPADLPRGGGGLHPALLRALPGREALHRRDDRQGGARRVRLHAARPAAGDPRAALQSAPAPLARRAAGRQHRDPGNRRGHHQAGDGALPRGACRGGNGDPARAPDPRRAAVRGAGGGDGPGHGARARARCAPPSTSTRRWRSTSASAGTGWPQSRGPPAPPTSISRQWTEASPCCSPPSSAA